MAGLDPAIRADPRVKPRGMTILGYAIGIMKLFQIEEPDGSSTDPDTPGAAIGIDATGKLAEVAFAVGGNAVTLSDREGFERDIAVPPLDANPSAWQEFFEWTRIRGMRALARPVTHAVLGVAKQPNESELASLKQAAQNAGLDLLLVLHWGSLDRAAAGGPALTLATLAEDAAPPPQAF